MSPKTASLLCITLILYLFFIERKNDKGVSNAIWVPFTWIFFNNSDKIFEWLNIASPNSYVSGNVYIEGNPFARNVYSILIIIGIVILLKRKIDWRTIFIRNHVIWLYLFFAAISLFWSDYPYVSLKRLVKAVGVVIMALVILTDTLPYIALGIIVKRISFILLPLSLLFIKYYPQFGRSYHFITGKPFYTGVGGTKNNLGVLCLMAGFFFSWSLIFGGRDDSDSCRRQHYTTYLIMIPMIIWLLYLANSATSLSSLLFALCLLVFARYPVFVREPRKIIVYGATILVLLGIIEYTFGFKETLIVMLGREPDLTNRIPMWEHLLSLVVNPLVGSGYESFWLGERLIIIQQRWGKLIQAHNGYLEMYLNMGIIGVLFIISWIVSGLMSVTRHLNIDYPVSILRLCLIAVVALYNYTEAVFYGVSTMWMLFFIGILNIPGQSTSYRQPKLL